MRKLSLDPAELAVESFDTFGAGERSGTVRGNGSCYTFSCTGTCGIVPDSSPEKDGGFAISEPPRNCCA